MNKNHFQKVKFPASDISCFVERFTALKDLSDFQNGIIVPNGRIDLILSKSEEGDFKISLVGLETHPKIAPDFKISVFFAISFNPIAIEYLFQESIADILNSGKILSENFWDFTCSDLHDFDEFCEKATQKIKSMVPVKIDKRKEYLFQLIFETNGEMSVKELSERVAWSERQMNRYFNTQFGISAKTYCNIIRFQAALPHIKRGKLYPELNFSDQSHFIKEIKKFSGVSPKELYKNENDRFLQFLTSDVI